MALPEDTTSPFRTATLDADWQGWIVGVEPGNHLSRTAITDFEVSGATATFNLHVFDLPAGELLYAIAAYADYMEPVRTFTWFSADPGNELSFLDAPTVETASSFHGEVAWAAPSDDVDDYVVLYNEALRNVAVLITPEPRAVMPQLPSAYDDAVSFPFPDGAGYVQVIARRGDRPPSDTASDPYAVDGTAATGPRRAITF